MNYKEFKDLFEHGTYVEQMGIDNFDQEYKQIFFNEDQQLIFNDMLLYNVKRVFYYIEDERFVFYNVAGQPIADVDEYRLVNTE